MSNVYSWSGGNALLGYYPFTTLVNVEATGSWSRYGTKSPSWNGTYGLDGVGCTYDYTVIGGGGCIWHGTSASRVIASPSGASLYLSVAGDPGAAGYYECLGVYGNWCYTISGSTSVTVTRLNLPVKVVSDSGEQLGPNVFAVKPGQFAHLRARSDSASIGGMEVPLRGQGGSWEYRSPGGRQTYCDAIPDQLYRTCTKRIDSTQTLTLTMLTNGKWKTQVAQVIARRNFRLTVDRPSVQWGDTATFSPTLDGVPVPVTRWAFLPSDNGSGDASTGVAADHYGRRKMMVASGEMHAYVDYADGTTDSATAGVVVNIPRLHLTASAQYVTAGTEVTFTGSAEGAPISSPMWSWTPAGAPSASPSLSKSTTARQRLASRGSPRLNRSGLTPAQPRLDESASTTQQHAEPVTGPGTMVLVAMVAGMWQSDSVQVDTLPCPTGDRALDNIDVRTRLDSGWAQSRAAGKELVYAIFRDTTSGYQWIEEIPTSYADECWSKWTIPSPYSGTVLLGVAHTHPQYRDSEAITYCGGKYVGGTYETRKRGGGSPDDWKSLRKVDSTYKANYPANGPVYFYVIDGTRVFRLDPATPPGQEKKRAMSWTRNSSLCYQVLQKPTP